MTTKRILVVGDVHFCIKRLSHGARLASEIVRVVRQTAPDIVVFLGDVFDGHQSVHTDVMDLWADMVFHLACPKVIFVVGNHDMPNSTTYLPRSNAYSMLNILSENSAIEIVSRPDVIDGFGFIPYVPPGEFYRAYEFLQDRPKVVFAHQEFIGSTMNAKVSEKGDALPKDFLVISGHIHGEQTLGNVWYPGTPAQTNFGESTDKAVYLIESDKIGYSVKEKIKLNMPAMVTGEFDVSTATKQAFDLSASDLHRVIVTGTVAELAAFKQSPNYAELMAKSKLVLKANPDEKIVSFHRGKTFEQILREECAAKGLSEILEEITNVA